MNLVNTKPYQLPANATWLITGCSSGIGRALATLISQQPDQRLIATARNPSTLSYLPSSPNILPLALDVTSPPTISAAFQAAADHFGESHHIDVVVNNAGYSLSGDTESATEEEMHDELETNFFGTVRVSMKAVERMRQEQHGRGGIIFNLSSLAGVIGFAGHAFYHASKFAVEGWTESVAREMHPDWNINFSIIEPAGVRTEFEGHSKKTTARHAAYAAADMPARRLEHYVDMGIKSGAAMLEPDEIAQTLWRVASAREPVPLHVPIGATAVALIRAKLQSRLTGLEGT